MRDLLPRLPEPHRERGDDRADRQQDEQTNCVRRKADNRTITRVMSGSSASKVA